MAPRAVERLARTRHGFRPRRARRRRRLHWPRWPSGGAAGSRPGCCRCSCRERGSSMPALVVAASCSSPSPARCWPAALVLVATQPFELESALTRRALAALLLVDLGLLAFRLFAVADAWRAGRGVASSSRRLRAGADGRAHRRPARRRRVRRRPRVRRPRLRLRRRGARRRARLARASSSPSHSRSPSREGLDAPNAGLDRLTPFRGKEVPLSDTRHVFLAASRRSASRG